jgi:hypothetical protein
MRVMNAAATAVAAVVAVAALACAGAAVAGPASDDLGRCLIKASTPADNEVLVRWMFSAITANPKLASYAAIKPEERDAFDRRAAELFQRLLLTDCRKESVAALQQDGTSAIGHSFELLGSVAARQLMSDPAVTGGMQHMTRYLDNTAWQSFAAEAGPGVTPPPAAAPPK